MFNHAFGGAAKEIPIILSFQSCVCLPPKIKRLIYASLDFS